MTKNHATRRAVVAAIAAAGLPLALAAQEAQPDAGLLNLGRRLETAWAHERELEDAQPFDEEVFDAAVTATRAIVDRIIKAKAATLDGLKVKALALAWCGDFEGLAERPGDLDARTGRIVMAEPTTDQLVGDSILFDLIAMLGSAAA